MEKSNEESKENLQLNKAYERNKVQSRSISIACHQSCIGPTHNIQKPRPNKREGDEAKCESLNNYQQSFLFLFRITERARRTRAPGPPTSRGTLTNKHEICFKTAHFCLCIWQNVLKCRLWHTQSHTLFVPHPLSSLLQYASSFLAVFYFIKRYHRVYHDVLCVLKGQHLTSPNPNAMRLT